MSDPASKFLVLNLEALTLASKMGVPYIKRLPLNPWRMPYRYEYRPDKPYIFTVSPTGVQIDNAP